MRGTAFLGIQRGEFLLEIMPIGRMGQKIEFVLGIEPLLKGRGQKL